MKVLYLSIAFIMLIISCKKNHKNNFEFGKLDKNIQIHILKNSIDKTINTILKNNLYWEQDGIWALEQTNHYLNNPELKNFIQIYKEKLKNHPLERMINPEAKKYRLNNKSSYGFQKLFRYIISPISEPENLAKKNIIEFINLKNQKGYILTHQYIVLLFSEREKLKLPFNISSKKNEFMQLILKEQLNDQNFSDLFCERVFLILYYYPNYPKYIQKVDRWIEIILNAQTKEGIYIDNKIQTYNFMNEIIYLKGIITHTTSLCFACIVKYYIYLKYNINL